MHDIADAVGNATVERLGIRNEAQKLLRGVSDDTIVMYLSHDIAQSPNVVRTMKQDMLQIGEPDTVVEMVDIHMKECVLSDGTRWILGYSDEADKLVCQRVDTYDADGDDWFEWDERFFHMIYAKPQPAYAVFNALRQEDWMLAFEAMDYPYAEQHDMLDDTFPSMTVRFTIDVWNDRRAEQRRIMLYVTIPELEHYTHDATGWIFSRAEFEAMT